MGSMPTFNTAKLGLTPAAFLLHMTTVMTGNAGVFWGNTDEKTPAPKLLVRQLSPELSPALIQYRPIQA